MSVIYYQQDVFVTFFYRFLLHGISKETSQTTFYLHIALVKNIYIIRLSTRMILENWTFCFHANFTWKFFSSPTYVSSQTFVHRTWKELVTNWSQWAKFFFIKVQAKKKLVKSNKSNSRKFFLTKIHFLLFQNWTKIDFLNWRKV